MSASRATGPGPVRAAAGRSTGASLASLVVALLALLVGVQVAGAVPAAAAGPHLALPSTAGPSAAADSSRDLATTGPGRAPAVLVATAAAPSGPGHLPWADVGPLDRGPRLAVAGLPAPALPPAARAAAVAAAHPVRGPPV